MNWQQMFLLAFLCLILLSVSVVLLWQEPKNSQILYNHISGEEVNNLISPLNINKVVLLDEDYKTMSLKKFKNFLEEDKLDEENYVKNFFDCDDFAFELMSRVKKKHPNLAIGILMTKSHAINIIVLDNKIYYVLPQTDVVKLEFNEEIELVII